ncbi:hypothetical protein [Legionella pneumophila]|uniref:hypothetical protein n=1 Tax=Legionella pneumophila TaxID=446 RepID=UPI00077778B7|nr:hypothetical protein [Legionella pneumophila]MDW8872776.1 hypothetical protein [Legionella pneumophila]HAT8656826.1 hypothetical protein [Legionella pneumophila]
MNSKVIPSYEHFCESLHKATLAIHDQSASLNDRVLNLSKINCAHNELLELVKQEFASFDSSITFPNSMLLPKVFSEEQFKKERDRLLYSIDEYRELLLVVAEIKRKHYRLH